MRSAAVVIAAVVAASAASAADKHAIYDIALDLNRDGKADRAVLVTSSADTDSYSDDKSWYWLATDERVDLYIYFGAGDAPLDLSKPPDVLAPGIVTAERINQIYPPEARTNGALVIRGAYYLFSNSASERLTIVERKSELVVAGYTYDFEWKTGEQGGCDVNLLTGKGIRYSGADSAKKTVRVPAKPVPLLQWSSRTYPKPCRF
jgi:hypothetical protein